MTPEERQRLKQAVDARRRALCGIGSAIGVRRPCEAISIHSGRPCRFKAVSGRDFCRKHLDHEVAA